MSDSNRKLRAPSWRGVPRHQSKISFADWQSRLTKLVAAIGRKPSNQVIDSLVELSPAIPDDELIAFFRWDARAKPFAYMATKAYNDYILKMENDTVAAILSSKIVPGTNFCDVAGHEATIAYDRVAAIFDKLDLKPATNFVMVGCGQLPVTSIHVMERAGCAKIVCMDVIASAVKTVERLKQVFGWHALHPVLCDGAEYDFSSADVVYVANMVCPKAAVLDQIARSASRKCQIVMRDPYGLGMLWAEHGEESLPQNLSVESYGSGSRYLSRDAFLKWRR